MAIYNAITTYVVPEKVKFNPNSSVQIEKNINENANDSITTIFSRAVFVSGTWSTNGGRRGKFLLEQKVYTNNSGIFCPWIYARDKMIDIGG